MPLEQAIQEQTVAIKALTAVLTSFKFPSAGAVEPSRPQEKSKTEPAKAATVEAKPAKEKAKTPEAEQKEALQEVLDEEGEFEEEEEEEVNPNALPVGKRDEAYIRVHIMPKLLDLAKATSKETVLALIGKFKTVSGEKVVKSTDLKGTDLEKVLELVRAEMAAVEAAKSEEV
jgi:hypothetical protein